MTKKSFLTLVSAVFLVLMIAACGNDKNKDESENTDTGDTDTTAVTETDPTDTGDKETVSDTDPTDTGDAEVVPDEDNTDTENTTHEGCTIKSSFGTHSLKRDMKDICIKEIVAALFPECGWQDSEESTTDHIAFLQRLDVTFGNECKDKNNEDKSVECPGFIPQSLKLSQLAGCDVYSIDPYSACIAPCADLYFSTDNENFKTVYAGSAYIYDGLHNFIKSSGEGGVSLESMFEIGTNEAVFTWIEKTENGTEIERKISVEMEITDPDKCKDRDGRQYYEGDLIPEKCGIMVCEEKGWEVYYNNRPECQICNKEESETKYWTCHDYTTVLEWCNCEEDKETSDKWGENYGKWSCIDRIDLQCPPRIEKCEDSEGRIYQHNDKIALECDYVYCTYNGWQTSGEPPLCELTCPNIIGEKRKWLCADGVTEVDWCECVEDEEFGGIWTYIERADLNCPTE